jgi:probable F420-dependent oxidoreductase
MARDLGRVGVMSGEISQGDRAVALTSAVELEELGYSTVWLPGSQSNNLPRIADVVKATRKITVGSAIVPVLLVPAAAVAEAYADLNATHPDRFVVGLGGAHVPKPLATLNAYLDQLDTVGHTVPRSARVLAAFGPRMLELARDRAAGAFPILVTTGWVEQARELLGPDTTLVTALRVVVEAQADRAREKARDSIAFLKTVPAYAANFRRMGFNQDDIDHSSDRLIDAITAWGDADAIAARVSDYLRAGADQVAINVVAGGEGEADGTLPTSEWRLLAGKLLS